MLDKVGMLGKAMSVATHASVEIILHRIKKHGLERTLEQLRKVCPDADTTHVHGLSKRNTNGDELWDSFLANVEIVNNTMKQVDNKHTCGDNCQCDDHSEDWKKDKSNKDEGETHLGKDWLK